MIRKLVTTAALAATALTGVAATAAAPASAAVRLFESPYSMNTLYGRAAGHGWITNDLKTLTVDTYLTDRHDGHYATLQARALVSDGLTKWWGPWAAVKTTANETTPQYGSRALVAGTGRVVTDAQVRICQTTATGAISGVCTAPVNLDNWYVVVV